MDELVGPPHPEILEEEVDTEVLLLDPRSGKYYALNQTASDVWRLADGESTLQQIVDLLAEAYGTTAVDIQDEVRQAVDDFRAGDLLGSIDVERS